ncbi:MAG: M23 family metallopeptidase [Patescibacteria group bacterium]
MYEIDIELSLGQHIVRIFLVLIVFIGVFLLIRNIDLYISPEDRETFMMAVFPERTSEEELDRIRTTLVEIHAEEEGIGVPTDPTALAERTEEVLVTGSGEYVCPVVPGPDEVVSMTQGYGIGSHEPAEAWGAIDLAVKDRTGQAIVAPAGGLVKRITPGSWPAGNHIWLLVVTQDGPYLFGFSHLSSFTVSAGDIVQQGQQIGVLGNTGKSYGSHLDFQMWTAYGEGMTAEKHINLNPLEYGFREACGI